MLINCSQTTGASWFWMAALPLYPLPPRGGKSEWNLEFVIMRAKGTRVCVPTYMCMPNLAHGHCGTLPSLCDALSLITLCFVEKETHTHTPTFWCKQQQLRLLWFPGVAFSHKVPANLVCWSPYRVLAMWGRWCSNSITVPKCLMNNPVSWMWHDLVTTQLNVLGLGCFQMMAFC